MTEAQLALPQQQAAALRAGGVLPAHPLVLHEDRTLDELRQAALTRYYLDAGAAGVAVGVHTTQFAIRKHGMYEPVLRLAAETTRQWGRADSLLIAGVTGPTPQATAEAAIARDLGYHAALVNVASFRDQPESATLAHCVAVAAELPIIGFALLPEVGGFHLSYEFWRRFAEIDNVVAIKMAPFNRYRTVDIVRAVIDARAEDRITLYTGNDDHIVLDLLVPFAAKRDGAEVRVRVRGGLLGHWSVWTRSAVRMLETIHSLPDDAAVPTDLLALDSIVTDANGAIYDGLNDFRGAIPGCLEVLRRQGLVEGTWCLDPAETLSPGQLEQIDRVLRDHPDLTDDEFVTEHLEKWMTRA